MSTRLRKLLVEQIQLLQEWSQNIEMEIERKKDALKTAKETLEEYAEEIQTIRKMLELVTEPCEKS